MSLLTSDGLTPTGLDGERLRLEPLSVRDEPLPVLDDPKALASVQATLAGAIIVSGYTMKEAALICGVSERTVKRRWASVRPGMPIPKLAPLTGADPAWSPAVEDRRSNPGRCKRCGADDGPIQPGMQLACLACGRTGFDDQAAADRLEDERVRERRKALAQAERKRTLALRRAAKARNKQGAG